MSIANLVDSLYREQPVRELYHYTSLSGLMSMVASGCLYATDMRFFSDAAELRHTSDILRVYISQRAEEKGSNFNTEEYNSIHENDFKDALSNPLSTFSIDVDKASYSNVRRFLSQNQLLRNIHAHFTRNDLISSAQHDKYTLQNLPA